MPYQRDTLYDTPQAVVDFRFDERTAAVFPDMIHRSVPGYATLLQLFAVIGAGFVREGGHVYDLGCALGGASIALQRHIPPTATIDAVDNAEAMTRRLAAYVEGAGIRNIRVQQADITALDYRPADLIIMAFTLQFIPPEARDALLVRLRQTLHPGGALGRRPGSGSRARSGPSPPAAGAERPAAAAFPAAGSAAVRVFPASGRAAVAVAHQSGGQDRTGRPDQRRGIQHPRPE